MWSPLIEENSRSGRCERTLRRVIENRLDLFDRDTWKPLNELGSGCTTFQVLEQGRKWGRWFRKTPTRHSQPQGGVQRPGTMTNR